MFLRRLCLMTIAAISVAGDVAAQSAPLAHYYFPQGETCTLMLDFQTRRATLETMAPDARNAELLREMVAAFRSGYAAHCPNASKATLLAVYIPGVDSYGRPNFGSRQNLIRADGAADAIKRAPPAMSAAELARILTIAAF